LSVDSVIAGVQKVADAYVAAAQGASMLSKVTNATVEDASRFNAVASRTGLEMNDLVEIFSDFQQAVAKNPDALARMGVQLTKNSQGQTDWLRTAEEFMTAVQGIGDATERNRLMFQFFGEEGAKQLMVLINSGQSLEEALKNVPKGLIIDPEGVKAAQEYQQAMAHLKGDMDALAVSLGQAVVPALADAAEGLIVIADLLNKMPKGAVEALVSVMSPLVGVLGGIGRLFGDDAAAAEDYAAATEKAATAQQSLTALIASGVTSGERFAAAVRSAGDELAAQETNARLAAQALDVYRASTDQAYESTLKLLGLDRSERSAQRAAEGAADAAGDAKANMDKALADAKAAKTVVENIAAIRGRERKKEETAGIVAGSTDVREIEGIKGRKAQKKTRVIEAAGVITPAEARQIREATRQYEQSLDDIAAAWEALAEARIKHKEALGLTLTEAEKLDEVRQALQEGLQVPGLSPESKAGIKADLAVVTAQIKALGGVPIELDGIRFKGGTTQKQVDALQKQIGAALDKNNAPLAHQLQSQLDAMVEGGQKDLNVTLGLDPASVTAAQADLANLGIDPRTGKPYTAKTKATVDTSKAKSDLDALTKPRTVTVTVDVIPGIGSVGGTSPMLPPTPGGRLTFSGPAQTVSFNPTVVNNYPKPERASDSVAASLRTAKYMVGA
jgi:hypothetical protein